MLLTPLLSLDSKVAVILSRRQSNMCNSSHVSTTHVIMEGFRFAGVVTCLSPLWCSTIQVPEYTVDNKTGHEANKTAQTNLWTCLQGDKNMITYHHQECRNPGGSPSVMFFSHRIWERGISKIHPWVTLRYIFIFLQNSRYST